jgi:hypothetical protein
MSPIASKENTIKAANYPSFASTPETTVNIIKPTEMRESIGSAMKNMIVATINISVFMSNVVYNLSMANAKRG